MTKSSSKPDSTKAVGVPDPKNIDRWRGEFNLKTKPPFQSSPLPAQVLLTRKQLADRWSCCSHTIARRKDLKPVRFNIRMIRYRLVDIEAVEAAAAA
jgi:hypothetical protein